MQQAPSTGQVSPDGQFAWNGSEWAPLTGFHWEPTATTRPMQLLAGAYLIVAGLLTTILSYFAVPSLRQQIDKSLSEQNPAMTSDQIKTSVDLGINFGIAIAVVIGLIYVAFGIVTLFRRWGWLFYADLVICGLGGLGVFTGLLGLARGNAGPLRLLVPNLVLALAALALFVWLLMTRIRGRVWGARRVWDL